MPNRSERIEFENNRVRVLRVKMGPHERTTRQARGDRVIVWLSDSHKSRVEASGQLEEIRRKNGEVVWRAASEHAVENLSNESEELIIVELK